MKLLFLDIDGVLNSADYIHSLDKDSTPIIDIDYNTLPLLKEVLDKTGAKIVLSSSWRLFDKHKTNYLIPALQSIGYEIFSETPDSKSGNRGLEILDELTYLKKYRELEITGYAVLDDEVSDILTIIPKANIVKTSWQHGLQQQHVTKLIKILNGGNNKWKRVT